MTQDGTAMAVRGGGSVGATRRIFNSWNFCDVTSQAGFLDIEPASPIVTAISTRNGVLFWTAKKAYISKFIGIPYVYNYTEIADNCTPWSPESMVTTSSQALWMSKQGLFAYDGTIIAPVACMVRPWIDDDIDPLNVREQACAVHVADFNEFWWFFPQLGQPHNTRAIIFNYKEGWFSQAQMSRSAGDHRVVQRADDHGRRHGRFSARARRRLQQCRAALRRDVRPQSDLRLEVGHDQADDPRHRGRHRQCPICRCSTATAAAWAWPNSRRRRARCARTAMSTFGRRAATFGCAFSWSGPAVNPVTVGQHLVDGVQRGDR